MKSLTSSAGIGDVLALAGHVVRQDHRLAIAEVRADQIGVVDPAVIDVLAGLHLGLQLLDHVAFLDQVVLDLDAGDFGEGLRQRPGFILVRRDGFRHDVDFHALEGLRRPFRTTAVPSTGRPSTGSRAGIRCRSIVWLVASSASAGAAIVTEAAISTAALVMVRKLFLVKDRSSLKCRMLVPPVAATNKLQARVDPGSALFRVLRRCGRSQRPKQAKSRWRATGSKFQCPLRSERSGSCRCRRSRSTADG